MSDILTSIFFLDIKTVGIVDRFESLSDTSKLLWLSKKGLTADKLDLASQFFKEEAGLSTEFNRIAVIHIGYFRFKNQNFEFRIKSFENENEKMLLHEFNTLYQDLEQRRQSWYFLSYNGYNFHYPLLFKKYLIHNLKIPNSLSLLHRKSWQLIHRDFTQYWPGWDRKEYVSLKLLGHTFDILSPDTILDNKKLHDIYYEESSSRIVEISKQDLILLAKLFLKVEQLDYQLTDENIKQV